MLVLKINLLMISNCKEVIKHVEVETQSSNDNRSYHITSEKIKVLNFKTNKTIKNAVEDLHAAFNKNLFNDPLNNEMYFNIKRMKSINLK